MERGSKLTDPLGEPLPPNAVRNQLEKILASDAFCQSRRLSRFLRYTVEQALKGDAEQFKEFVLGVEVFDKAATFDPRIDSIVRVEACRLRARLKIYYQSEGQWDPVVIEYHKGSYMPVFHLRELTEAPEEERRREIPGARTWKTIVVLPFSDVSPGSDQGYLVDGLAEELIYALTKVHGLRVVAQTSAFQYKGRAVDIRHIGRELQADMVLEGSVRKAGPILRTTAQLVDVATGYILWSGTYERLLEDVFAVQEEISRAIADALKAQFQTDAGQAPFPEA